MAKHEYTITMNPITPEAMERIKAEIRKAIKPVLMGANGGLRPKSSTYGVALPAATVEDLPDPTPLKVDCPCGKHQIDAGADPQIAHREHYYGKDGVLGPQSNLDWAKPVGASARVEFVPQADDMYEP